MGGRARAPRDTVLRDTNWRPTRRRAARRELVRAAARRCFLPVPTTSSGQRSGCSSSPGRPDAAHARMASGQLEPGDVAVFPQARRPAQGNERDRGDGARRHSSTRRMTTRTVSAVAFVTLCPPAGPCGKTATSPGSSCRSPSGVRSVGRPATHEQPLLRPELVVVRARALAGRQLVQASRRAARRRVARRFASRGAGNPRAPARSPTRARRRG